jgi:hypothetical protein
MGRQLPEARRGFAKLLRRPGVVQEGWKASSVETPPYAGGAEREQNFFFFQVESCQGGTEAMGEARALGRRKSEDASARSLRSCITAEKSWKGQGQ